MLAKTNLDCIINSVSRPLTNSYIEHNYFLLIDALRGHEVMKKNKSTWIKTLNKLIKTLNKLIKQCYGIVWVLKKYRK